MLVPVIVGEALEVGHLLLPRVQRRLHHRVHRRLRRELPVVLRGWWRTMGRVSTHTVEAARGNCGREGPHALVKVVDVDGAAAARGNELGRIALGQHLLPVVAREVRVPLVFIGLVAWS